MSSADGAIKLFSCGAGWPLRAGSDWRYPYWGQFYSLSHLGLTHAYALAGDAARSRSAFRDFFALWKGSDSNIPLLKLAQSDYAKLK